MYVEVQPFIPGSGPTAIHARLDVLQAPEGPVSLAWRVETHPGSDLLALGSLLRQVPQDVGRIAPHVLEELLRVTTTLADPPPFP